MAVPASKIVGYRFYPTDEEIVDHYLKNKLLGNEQVIKDAITEIDVCQFEPDELPAFSKLKSDDQEWFFFSPLRYTKNRCNRQTKAGFWKPTGKDREIKIQGTENVIGTKKTLVFYKGRSSHSAKTNWVIHEYHADAHTFPEHMGGFVLCRLMNKAEKKAEKPFAVDRENKEMENDIPSLFTLPEKVDMESIFATPSQAQESSSQGSLFVNANVGEGNGILRILLKTNEEKDNLEKFLDEILAGGDALIDDETMNREINVKQVFPLDDQLNNDSSTACFGLSTRKRARRDGESCNVEVNSNSVNSLAENRPLKEERLDFIDTKHCLEDEVVRLNLLLSILAEEFAAVKVEADQVKDMKKSLADVLNQIRCIAAIVKKLIAVKDEENERSVNLKRIATKLGIGLESEWTSRKTEVKEIQESALQNHVHCFGWEVPQVRLIYPEIPDMDLSMDDIFKDIVSGPLLVPSCHLLLQQFPQV